MDTNLQALPFSYVVVSPALAANGTGVSTLRIQADSDFEVQYFLGTSTADAVTDFTSNNFSVLVSDQATGRALSSARVPQRLFCGNAQNSTPELNRVRFVAQTDLTFDFLNLTGSTLTVSIVMKGTKYLI